MPLPNRPNLALPRNLDINLAKRTRISIVRAVADHVSGRGVAVADLEVVALAAPGAVPVDGADLGVVLVEVDGALGARGGVGAAARGDVGRAVGRDGDLADLGAGDLRVLVAVFVEFAPVCCEWILVAKVWRVVGATRGLGRS